MSERMTLPVLPLRDAVLFPASRRRWRGPSRDITCYRSSPQAIRPQGLRRRSEGEHRSGIPGVALHHRHDRAHQSVQRNLGGVQLILHGESRGTAVHYTEPNGYLEATVRETPDLPPLNEKDAAFVALHREVRGTCRGARSRRRVCRPRSCSRSWRA